MTPLDVLKLAGDGSPWAMAIFMATLFWLERKKSAQQEENNKQLSEKQMEVAIAQIQAMTELKTAVQSIRDSINHVMSRLP